MTQRTNWLIMDNTDWKYYLEKQIYNLKNIITHTNIDCMMSCVWTHKSTKHKQEYAEVFPRKRMEQKGK